MSCKGIHCGGCGDGHGRAGLAGLAVLVIGGAAVYHVLTSPAVAHAIRTAFTIAAWTVGTVAALAIAGGLTWAALGIHRMLSGRSVPARSVPARSGARPIPAPLQEPPSLRVVSVRVLPNEPVYGAQEPARAPERERSAVRAPGRAGGSAGR
jgi:hypothetical protein